MEAAMGLVRSLAASLRVYVRVGAKVGEVNMIDFRHKRLLANQEKAVTCIQLLV